MLERSVTGRDRCESLMRADGQVLSMYRPETGDSSGVRRGELILCPDHFSERTLAWFFFEESPASQRLLLGVARLGAGEDVRYGFYRCVVTLDTLAAAANGIGPDCERRPFLLTTRGEGDIVWTVSGESDHHIDDASEWVPFAVMTYGLPAERRPFPLRWIRFAPLSARDLTPPPAVPVTRLDDDRVQRLLTQVVDTGRQVRRVRPYVSGKPATYEIDFVDAENGELHGIYESPLTQDVRAVLRDPFDRGIPYLLEGRPPLTWDPESDIDYGWLSADSGRIPLRFLRYYVLRHGTPLGLELPETSHDLAQMTMREDAEFVFRHESSRCPGRGSHGICWRLTVTGVAPGRLAALEGLTLDSRAVVRIVEMRIFVDVSSGIIYQPTMRVVVDDPSFVPPREFLQSDIVGRILVDDEDYG